MTGAGFVARAAAIVPADAAWDLATRLAQQLPAATSLAARALSGGDRRQPVLS